MMYLDANNLYGWAMSQDLPTGDFKWMKKTEEFTVKRISKLVKKNKHDYYLEVDVEYREILHDKHNRLPFMPEKMKIEGVQKLTPNLFGKEKYMIHIQALDQALKHGIILKKVH